MRTKPFLQKLADAGVTGRGGGPITINTLMALEKKLGLVVERLKRDDSRVWTDDHLAQIKAYWLETKSGVPIVGGGKKG